VDQRLNASLAVDSRNLRTRQLTLTTASEQVNSVTCYKMRKPTSRQTVVELNRHVSVLFVSQAEC